MTASLSAKKKRRNLQSPRLARVHQLYSGEDVIKLYEISRNTLTNWIGEGFQFVAAEPRLFRGADLNVFHGLMSAKARGQPLGPFAARCLGCKRAHSLTEGEISVAPGRSEGVFKGSRRCPDTSVQANRYVSSDELTLWRDVAEPVPEARLQTNMLPLSLRGLGKVT